MYRSLFTRIRSEKLSTLVFLLMALNLFAQTPSSVESPLIEQEIALNSITLSGQLVNFNPDFDKDFTIKLVQIVPYLKSRKTSKIPIGEDGSFKVELSRQSEYTMFWLYIDELYYGKMVVNDDLKMMCDIDQLYKKPIEFYGKGVTFEGTNANLIKFINEYAQYNTKKKRELNKEKFNSLMNRTAQPIYKVKKIRAVYDELVKIEKSYTKKKKSKYNWILENERQSQMLADFISVYLGDILDKDILDEIVQHEPFAFTDASVQYYDLLSFYLSNPSRQELKALSRKVYIIDPESKEEEDRVNAFLSEVDKKNAGLIYDNELYAEGVKEYVKKYESSLEMAKLDLFKSKLSTLPKAKKALTILKGQPLENVSRREYIVQLIPEIELDFWKGILQKEMDNQNNVLEQLQGLFENTYASKGTYNIGKDETHLASGAGLYIAHDIRLSDLIHQIQGSYPGKDLILCFWATWNNPSINDMRKSLAMVDRLQDNDIQVVYLCLNEKTDKEEWKTILSNLYIGGEHVFLTKQLSAEAQEILDFYTLPYCFLASKNGKVYPNYVESVSRIDIPSLLSKLERGRSKE